LYTLPFFPTKRNARNWAGLKIYIVAICWVGVTLLLPIINSNLPFTIEVLSLALQRFILVFVLILLFEIVDLKTDDLHLKTVPQQIGVKKTKLIGSFLLLIFLFLELISSDFNPRNLGLKLGLALTVFLFLYYSHENRSRYYASFWVESIPIVWYLCLFFL
jgi:hypothetical protein